MAKIIALRDTPHQAVEALLPWYVGGTLDADDRAAVEAHLQACPDCQAALNLERRLCLEVAALPSDGRPDWSRLQRRMAGRAVRRRASGAFAGMAGAWRAAPSWLGWALAAQAALLAVFGALALPVSSPAYHALSAPPAPLVGNIIVIFRPETRERDLRAALLTNHARLVDGPTASDAYVLNTPAAERGAILTRLRARADVVLAEPINAGATP